ncbi:MULTISPECIES: CHAT domain-containing protein [Streptomyces]|uniref:CHAT domain-containing protein n=1 Tax=Streptomyces TaxID=1883 RepID=UPI0036B69A1A
MWGVDAAADVRRLVDELKWRSYYPDAAQHLIPTVLFIRSLHTWCSYDTGALPLMNLEGSLLRQYYRETGELTAGLRAVAILRECAETEAEPLARYAILHNLALSINSLLAGGDPELALTGGPESYRAIGVAAAENALEICSVLVEEAESLEKRTNMQEGLARTRHALGSLLQSGDASREDLDKAVRLFDLALTDPALGEVRGSLRVSRAEALLSLTESSVSPPLQALRDVLASFDSPRNLDIQQFCRNLIMIARMQEARGDPHGALASFQLAARTAQEQLLIADDETTLGHGAVQYCNAFDEVARLQVALGRPRSALETVETVRATTVRFGRETPEDIRRRVSASLVRVLVGPRVHLPSRRRVLTRWHIIPRIPVQIRKDVAELVNIDRPSKRINRGLMALRDAGWPDDTAICSFTATSGKMSAILAFPDGARGWDVQGHQWPIDPNTLERVIAGLHLEPGTFRERRLRRSCAEAHKIMLGGIEKVIQDWGGKRIAISAPGPLSHVAYEGIPLDGAQLLGRKFELFYLPSVLLGNHLAQRVVGEQGTRVLAVVYSGTDLPRVSVEVERLRELWTDRVDVLYGADCTKADVLNTLGGDYHLVHFACHGTFNPLAPLRSALHLTDDHSNDSKRVTAGDLLERRFTRDPVVTLSACSSGLTSFGTTNDCTGLTGSFLRMGARAVIASRWAVYDDTAEKFIRHLYTAMAEGITPQRAVACAQRALSADQGLEDWASFSYMGTP